MHKLNQPLTSETACPACGATQARVVATRDGKTARPLLTVECAGCGLGRIDPLPSKEELHTWYTEHYRQAYKGVVTPQLRHVLRAGRNALQRWEWVSGHAQQHWQTGAGPAKTLDIGASSGEFVYLMQNMGFDARGIEPHAGYASHARDVLGLHILHGSLEDQLAAFEPRSLQLVTLFHVLEHLVDPVPTLRRLAGLLAPDGLLYIEVPNAARFCAPHSMFFRAHTLYFSAQSLQQVFLAAGLRIVAQNAASDDNLVLVAQAGLPSSGTSTSSPPLAPHWQPGTALTQAQHKRRWLPYLWQQLRRGQAVRNTLRRLEERRHAMNFPHARALLDGLYASRH